MLALELAPHCRVRGPWLGLRARRAVLSCALVVHWPRALTPPLAPHSQQCQMPGEQLADTRATNEHLPDDPSKTRSPLRRPTDTYQLLSFPLARLARPTLDQRPAAIDLCADKVGTATAPWRRRQSPQRAQQVGAALAPGSGSGANARPHSPRPATHSAPHTHNRLINPHNALGPPSHQINIQLRELVQHFAIVALGENSAELSAICFHAARAPSRHCCHVDLYKRSHLLSLGARDPPLRAGLCTARTLTRARHDPQSQRSQATHSVCSPR